MKRDLTMLIRIPKENETDFRLYTVLHGGEIVNVSSSDDNRWTPVSECLPEPWASVLITFFGKYGSLTADHAIGIGSWDDVNGWYFEEIEGYTDSLTVSAWMNLPESYKEE